MREAIIHIPHAEYEKVGLGDVMLELREAGLRDITELVCRSDGCIVVVTVGEQIDEETLSNSRYLEWWERLSGTADEAVYLFKFSFPESDPGYQFMENQGVPSDDIRVTDQGMDVALVGSQQDIARELDDYAEAGMNVLLQRMGDYTGPRNTLAALTDRQREILETAYQLGYFDVPRRVSTTDIAEEINLDPSTVAEHLQRAERNLFDNLLASA